ncbi:hypothetical protein GCM10010431_74300 [Streptomyces kunmingensis]
MVPERLWQMFQRIVPPAPVRPQGGGRQRYSDREVLAAIVFVATSDCTWNHLPPGFGPSGVTAFRRFTEWSEARVWARLQNLVSEMSTSDAEQAWVRSAVYAVSVRALEKTPGPPSPHPGQGAKSPGPVNGSASSGGRYMH